MDDVDDVEWNVVLGKLALANRICFADDVENLSIQFFTKQGKKLSDINILAKLLRDSFLLHNQNLLELYQEHITNDDNIKAISFIVATLLKYQ